MTGSEVLYPPDYDTFQPPAVGGSYADPVFGSKITRVSDALATPNAADGGNLTWITGEYSSVCPFNADNSRLILIHESYFGLYHGDGGYLGELPFEINASSEPKWSRREPESLYYVHGNQLKKFNVLTGTSWVVRTFTEYSSITGRGESDISADGDHLVLCGDEHHVFIYQISTDQKSRVHETGGVAFDSLYITPDNNAIISWNQTGIWRTCGVELFDREMRFQRQVTRAGGHMAVTRDTNGDEVLIWTNSNDPQPISNNAIMKVRLANGHQTCLLELDWSLAVHISAPDNAGFAYVSTYAPGNPTLADWKPYTNEILRVALDGSEVRRLAHHRARPWNGYIWQPRAVCSRDGSRVVFNSNFNLQAGPGYSADYGDVYMMALGEQATEPPTQPVPVPPDEPAPQPDPIPDDTPALSEIFKRLDALEKEMKAIAREVKRGRASRR